MANLIAETPLAGLLPLTIGGVTITEVTHDRITSVAPFAGQAKSASDAIKSATGIALPKPNRVTSKGAAQAVWSGAGQALVCNATLPDLTGMAAVTDQSDAWAIAELRGPDVVAVLARLVPIDLRADRFKTGHSARTLLGHMTASVTRTGADRITVMVMRSMAGTLVHDLRAAANGVAARP